MVHEGVKRALAITFSKFKTSRDERGKFIARKLLLERTLSLVVQVQRLEDTRVTLARSSPTPATASLDSVWTTVLMRVVEAATALTKPDLAATIEGGKW